jgi:Tol biopolymer transport system component
MNVSKFTSLIKRYRIFPFLCIWLLACSPPQVTQAQLTVVVNADGKNYKVELPSGSTVQQAYEKVGITLSELDRSDPPVYTVLTDGSIINLTRVKEEFEVEQVTVPFERQVVQNESLPVGETRLSQPGENGLKEITYRRLFENDVEVSKTEVKTTILKEAIPEIVMVGSQTPYTTLPIPGKLAYLSAGNAWIMERTTGERRAVVTSGDLDGRIFSLSPNGDWLLFTRDMKQENVINSLWAVRLDTESSTLVDLKASNIVHFAAFSPNSMTVAYSTVEPRSAAPGWQANNDLYLIGISQSGFVTKARSLVDTNSGGVYGWWGTDYVWSPDGERIAYSRPDGIGIIQIQEDIVVTPLQDVTPFQTGGDWAWVPGIDWSPDGKVLYFVDHLAAEGSPSPEESTVFDLVANPLEAGPSVNLTSQVGMFAYPVASPLQSGDGSLPGETASQVAYLQAIIPSQSDTSRYQLVISDRDGSNKKVLFPESGAQGLDPQHVVWSPTTLGEDGGYAIAVVYQNNIWLVNTADNQAQQISGDGLTVRIDWR